MIPSCGPWSRVGALPRRSRERAVGFGSGTGATARDVRGGVGEGFIPASAVHRPPDSRRDMTRWLVQEPVNREPAGDSRGEDSRSPGFQEA